MSLPSPQALLTSIFETLTVPPSLSIDSSSLNNSPNPFKSLSASQRALLTTLHVIFPSPLLLQAFDLLDRGLVTRISLINPEDSNESHNVVDAGQKLSQTTKNTCDRARNPRYNVYQVNSSQSPKISSRFTHQVSASTSPAIYTVHLNAWNCSCAAFAFSAFPLPESKSYPWLDFRDNTSKEDMHVMNENSNEWAFGGVHVDYSEKDSIPICKHLLACLFIDRWDCVLGNYVNDIGLDKEGMAGTLWQN